MNLKKVAVILAIVAVFAVAALVGVVVMGDSEISGSSEGDDATLAGVSSDSSSDEGISFEDVGPNDRIIALDTNSDGKYDSVEIRKNDAGDQNSSMLTYDEYNSLSGEEQEEWLNEFESVDVFFDWYNGAEAVQNASEGEQGGVEGEIKAEMGVADAPEGWEN